jgi:hypothetical protein
MLGRLSNVADDVLESGTKSITKGAVARNVTNSLSSNMTNANKRIIQNAGADMVDAVKNEGRRTANNVINSRTAQNALDNFNSSSTLDVADSMIHPEVAATYTKGGGSRGRGGNRGYNNRTNYGKNKGGGTINFNNKNQQSKYFNGNNKGNQSAYFHTAESTVDMEVPDEAPKAFNMGTANNTVPEANPEQQVIKRRQGAGSRSQQRAMNNTQTASNTNGAVEPDFDIGNNYSTPEVEPQFAFNTGQANTSTGGGGNTSSANTANTSTRGNTQQRQTRSKSTRQPIDVKAKLGEKAGQYVDDFFGGITDTYNNVADGGDFLDSFKKAHQNTDGSINMKRAAGTFVAASAAARVASGGGVYKDRYGNPNLIGVPFI